MSRFCKKLDNLSPLAMVSVALLCGCQSQSYPYHQSYSYDQSSYQTSSHYQPTRPAAYVQPAYHSSPNVVVQDYGHSSDGALLSDSFKRRKAQLRQNYNEKVGEDRERAINDFLAKNDVWGVSETRENYKTSIILGRKKLNELYASLKTAGRNPDSDPGYLSVKRMLINNETRLKKLDDNIMLAITNKMTGEAAKRLILSEAQEKRAGAAEANLRNSNGF